MDIIYQDFSAKELMSRLGLTSATAHHYDQLVSICHDLNLTLEFVQRTTDNQSDILRLSTDSISSDFDCLSVETNTQTFCNHTAFSSINTAAAELSTALIEHFLKLDLLGHKHPHVSIEQLQALTI